MITAATRRRTARVGTLSALAAVAVAALACGTPAWGATGTDLPATTSTEGVPGSAVTDVVWNLPDSARAGDSLRLSLPDHAASTLADGTWTAHSGAVIGTVTLDADGELVLVLNDAADDPANRTGEAIVTTTETSTPGESASFTFPADGRLGADDVPGPFHGAPDRTAANKYGLWLESDPATVRWTIDTPKGPWDLITVEDPAPAGQSVDCTAGVSVRSTTQTEPETGYLVDLQPVAADRLTIACDDSGLRVDVSAVGDGEIVEVAFDALIAAGKTDVTNVATVTGTRTTPGTVTRQTVIEPVLAPVPTPTPTPTPSETVPPTHEVLAATGGSPLGAATGLTLAALCTLIGAVALGAAHRHGRRRSGL